MSTDLPIVTIVEAARLLGIKHDTLRHQCQFDHGKWADRQGLLASRLGAQKIGRDWYVDRALLDAELARRAAR